MAAWTTLTQMPEARNFCNATIHGEYLYVMGGTSDVFPGPFDTPILNVIRARINSDGTLGNWSTITQLPEGKVGAALLSVGNHIHSISGSLEVGAIGTAMRSSQRVFSLYVGPGDVVRDSISPGDFDPEDSIPLPATLNAAFTDGAGSAYITEGLALHGTLDFKNQTVNFQVGEIVTGGISGATLLIQSINDNGATGYVRSVNISDTVFVDGETLTGNLGGAAEVDGTLSNGTTAMPYILRAQVFGDGQLGSWSQYGSLAQLASLGGFNYSVTFYKNTVYGISGGKLHWADMQGVRDGVYSVLTAPNDIVVFQHIFAIDDTVVILGSINNNRQVYCIRLGSDGNPIGQWYRTADLPVPAFFIGAAVKGNRIYIVGGEDGVDPLPTVYMAEFRNGCIAGEKIAVPTP